MVENNLKGAKNKTNLLEELKSLLRKDDRLVSADKLLKNRIVELGLKLDKDLIKLLLSNERIKYHFFTEVDSTLVFDKEKFMKFIDNKEFLPDSYTAFKNKIGLTADKRYLAKSKEVVLSWPYKDCILEGGQEKENEKRKEVFYNEILAPDEIDRLLDPKVFTNFKRINSKGEHKATEIKPNDNLIVRGNNLIVLHSLKKWYSGKVKLIYIDPPYNTGNDEFKYNDSFNHSTWLSFMRNRLEIAKELLKDDGAIFIQCDDHELFYLKVLMDEIFERENFRECICVKTGSESGVNAINVIRGEQLFKVKEYLLFYSKNQLKHRFNPLYVKAMSYNYSYRYYTRKIKDNYVIEDMYKKILKKEFGKNTLRGLSNEEKHVFFAKFEEYCLKNSKDIYALKKDIQKSGEKFKEFANRNKKRNLVEEYKTSDGRIILVYQGGMLSNLDERIIQENGNKHYGLLISDFWWDIGATPSSEGRVELKSGKKPEKLIKRIFELITKKEDIVLDFFMGSGTTCAVAHKMGRQYIGVEQLDYGKNSAVVRLKNVIGKANSKGKLAETIEDYDTTGISKTVNWKGGADFVYMELKELNEEFVQKIQIAKDSKEFLKIWEEMKEHAFLSYRVDPELFDENIEEFKKLPAEKQKKILIKCIDLNHLYINYSEINDTQYKISKEDIEFNNIFYGGHSYVSSK